MKNIIPDFNLERETGYYWVKHYGEWTVANFENNEWWFCGSDIGVKEERLQEIDEKIIRK